MFRNPRTGDVITVPRCAYRKYVTSPRWVRVTPRKATPAPTETKDVDNASDN